jgi:hypothetical protein
MFLGQKRPSRILGSQGWGGGCLITVIWNVMPCNFGMDVKFITLMTQELLLATKACLKKFCKILKGHSLTKLSNGDFGPDGAEVVHEENVIFSNILHNEVTPKLVTWPHR